MEKRTIIAVIISTLIIVSGFTIQNILSTNNTSNTEPTQDTETTQEEQRPAEATNQTEQSRLNIQSADAPLNQCEPYFKNDTVEAVFSLETGGITSYKLLDYFEDGRPIEIFLADPTNPPPFSLLVGAEQEVLYGNYACNISDSTVEMFAVFSMANNTEERFTVRQAYKFVDGEYLMEHSVSIENDVNKAVPLGDNNISYSVYLGPQIGPQFETLDNRNEYRRHISLQDGRRRQQRFRRSTEETISERIQWVGITGKYFLVSIVPHSGIHSVSLRSRPSTAVGTNSEILLHRGSISASYQSDTYHVYIGPKIKSELQKYNDQSTNPFKVSDLRMEKIIDPRPLLGWLETILRVMLGAIYFIIPNYGIAIIILTIIVKAILYPLTSRSQRSMERMQQVAPKLQELREKYQDDRQKLNIEMANLYKKEGVNPAGGCLPLVIQFPFFIAMYGIFYNHFQLRNATFIPGWIDDLSSPESILSFGGFTVPIVNWTDLRLLPVLFLLSSIATTLMNKNPAQSAQQNKIMMLMPVVLFFVLYNLPSGLLIYWIVTNVLTIVQQMFTKRAKSLQNNNG